VPAWESIDEEGCVGAVGVAVLGVVVVLSPDRRIAFSARREAVSAAPCRGRTHIVSDAWPEDLIRKAQVTRAEYPGRVNRHAA
jgi:Zn-dependent alcohol dehydrogenase